MVELRGDSSAEREYDIIPRHSTSCSLLRYLHEMTFQVYGTISFISILLICDAGNTFVPMHLNMFSKLILY